MEILIVIMVFVLAALVALSFKFISEDAKKQKNQEDAKGRKIADLEAEMARKDLELKKMMEDRQRLEDEFFKAKNDIDVFKKDNAEISQRLKTLEKSKEETGDLRAELKQKDMMLQQETVARQKLQGEISLRESEVQKLSAEIENLKAELKTKAQMYEGLKSQFDEMENEMARIRGGAAKKEEADKGPAPSEMPQMPPAATRQPARPVSEPPKEPLKKDASLPGFPEPNKGMAEKKAEIPSDTEFLKAQPPAKTDTGPSVELPEGTFKLTNVNKPAPAAPEKDKDKSKSKRETLIPGFHPKEEKPESSS